MLCTTLTLNKDVIYCVCNNENNIKGIRSQQSILFAIPINVSIHLNKSIWTDVFFNKKAVLSQRWPRDARYISRSWAAAEIWPFEIIQDGGVYSAVRSAVPENPTLEPNVKWIGSPAAEIWPFAYVGGIWNPHFWGGRGGRRGQWWNH